MMSTWVPRPVEIWNNIYGKRIVCQVDYLQELYRDARLTEYKKSIK